MNEMIQNDFGLKTGRFRRLLFKIWAYGKESHFPGQRGKSPETHGKMEPLSYGTKVSIQSYTCGPRFTQTIDIALVDD